MVNRVVGHRCPAGRRGLMTEVASISCWHVAGGFSACDRIVMARHTGANHGAMINQTGRYRIERRREFLVTQIADIA